MRILRRFAKIIEAAKPPIVVLELGACDGYHTSLLVSILTAIGKPFRYFAFEPDERLRASFANHIKGKEQYVTLVNVAIGETKGIRKIWLSTGPGYFGSSSIRQPTGHLRVFPKCQFIEAETQTISLDEFCAQNGIEDVTFIWSDIQGAEAEMIRGGQRTLGKTQWIYTEADEGLYDGQATPKELLGLLPQFECLGRIEGNLLLRRRRAERDLFDISLINTLRLSPHVIPKLLAPLWFVLKSLPLRQCKDRSKQRLH